MAVVFRARAEEVTTTFMDPNLVGICQISQ
jgi:hypothetical protein